MPGSNNKVTFANGFRLEPSAAEEWFLMQDAPNTNDVSIINNQGNPEGVVQANMGSICQDNLNGNMYLKKTGTGPTGWQQIVSGTVTSGIETINGDSGSITGSTVTIFANNAANICGSTVEFVNSGTTSVLNVSDSVNQNTFIGQNCANLATTSTNSTALGYGCLPAITTGRWNTAIGNRSGEVLQGGNLNDSMGWASLSSCVSGSWNVAIGSQSMQNSTGNQNVAVGHSALSSYTGDGNVAVGYLAGRNVTGTGTVSIGWISLVNNNTGSSNTAVGFQSLTSINGGSNNTAYGFNSGAGLTTTDSGNIMIGYDVQGTAGDNNVTRIGKNQTQAYLAGVLNTNSGRVIKVTTPGAYPYTTLTTDHLILVDPII